MDYMRTMNTAINGTINMKAAVINTSTNVVENIIIVDSMSDPVPDGYMLAEFMNQFTFVIVVHGNGAI